MFIVNYMTTKEEKDDLLNIFNELDTNQDGSLSYEELLNGFNYFKLKNLNRIHQIFVPRGCYNRS
jgi:Ca2+-binding EF-hand superfamily protein